MKSFVVKFLSLTLLSFNGYAGPFNGGPGGRIGPDIRPDIRPNIRPGERGSNIQDALGSSQNQFSLLNPGSNQSVFLLNNVISQQLLNDGPSGTSDLAFNPFNPLPSGPFERDMHSEALPLVERDLTSNFILMPPPKPFASMVAKSRTQGMVFVTKSSQNSGESTNLITAGPYLAGLGFSLGQVIQFKQRKDQSTQGLIKKSLSVGALEKTTAAGSQGDERIEQAINNETQLIFSQLQLIKQQLIIFNNMLQSTGQTIGGMSQPVSADSPSDSISK
jgi:hypothetical protein